MIKGFAWLTFALVALVITISRPLSAEEASYRGKSIRIVVATSAGGGFDAYTRTLARHMGRHIPGNPSFLVENMPGAGHLIGANHIYKAAKADGLTFGHFQGGLFLEQLLARPGVEFDSQKFEFIGAPVSDNRACALTRASGITNVEKWLAAKTPVKIGGIGGGAPDDIARMLAATTALPIQLISGYKGTAEIRLASESGELAGGCWTWDSMRATWSKAITSGDAVVVLQILPKAHPELPNVPLASKYAKNDEARQLMQIGIEEPAAYYRPYALPPGTPKDRVQLLRRAFEQTLKDPEFLADAQKSKLDIDPISGEELEKMIAKLFKLNPLTVAKLKDILIVK
jgi:tripartite-type tricarboxylate transporter receptor subunit TctC